MSFRLLLVTVGLGLFVFFTPARAFAQATINVIQETSLPRVNQAGASIPKRSLTLEPEGVSLQDCLDDQRIAFPLQLAGYVAQSSLQAWAGLSGVDCGVQTNRTGPTRQCWQISNDIALEPNPRPAIPVRTIMSGVLKPDGPDPSIAICGQVNLTTISVQFLYFAPGQLATPATKKDLQVRVDTVGPDAPSVSEVLAGNTRIRISFGGLGEGGLTQFTGVKAYCDTATAGTVVIPPVVETVCSEGGADPDADPDAVAPDPVGDCEEVVVDAGRTTTDESVCASPNLTAGTDPDGGGATTRIVPDEAFNAKYQCGSLTGNTGSSLIADRLGGQPLTNFTRYAVAIAATDQFGNVGPLSTVLCAKPEPTSDFWESYKNAGGDAGGGICATSGPGLPVGGLAVTAFFGLTLIATIRRRRQQTRREQRAQQRRGARASGTCSTSSVKETTR